MYGIAERKKAKELKKRKKRYLPFLQEFKNCKDKISDNQKLVIQNEEIIVIKLNDSIKLINFALIN